MEDARYCANHASGHGQCPVCGGQYDSRMDRVYIRDYGCCMFCEYKREAAQGYAHRAAERAAS